MIKTSFLLLILLISVVSGLLLLGSCGSEERSRTATTSTESSTSRAALSVPVFNADSAWQYIADQLEFGYRIPGTEAHLECRDYLAAQLQAFGATVEVQEFSARLFESGRATRAFNLIGSFNPSARNRILLGAHWDSRYIADHDPDQNNRTQPVPGADDGGSGVGVLLEIARQISQQPLANIGVDIVFFDAEDQGIDGGREPESWGVGAQHWSRQIARSSQRHRYGILLDMVGASGPRFGKEGFSMRFAPEVVHTVWGIAQRLGYGHMFVNQEVPGVIDDHYFVNTIARIPMINIINRPPGTTTGFVPHWHTIHDNMEVIDRSTLYAVGHTVLEVLYREDAGLL